MLCVKEDEFELTDFEDYDDNNADIFADPVSSSEVCVYPTACRVVYSYQVGTKCHETTKANRRCSVSLSGIHIIVCCVVR